VQHAIDWWGGLGLTFPSDSLLIVWFIVRGGGTTRRYLLGLAPRMGGGGGLYGDWMGLNSRIEAMGLGPLGIGSTGGVVVFVLIL